MKDDPVSLPYTGEFPDIGALQYGNTGVLNMVPIAQPVVALPGQELSFSALIEGAEGSLSMEWDFGDGTLSHETAPNHTYKDAGDYIIRVSCVDSSGAVVRRIFLVRVE